MANPQACEVVEVAQIQVTSRSTHDSVSAALVGFTNVVRGQGVCQVCGTPVQGFELCWRCHEHQGIAGVADVVAALAYAVGGTDSARTLSTYKNHPVRARRQQASEVITDLLRRGIALHERCISAAAGVPISLRTVIPSLASRPGLHPLMSIAEAIGLVVNPVLAPGMRSAL